MRRSREKRRDSMKGEKWRRRKGKRIKERRQGSRGRKLRSKAWCSNEARIIGI